MTQLGMWSITLHGEIRKRRPGRPAHQKLRLVCSRCGIESPTTATGKLCAKCKAAGKPSASFQAVIDALRAEPLTAHIEIAARFGVSRENVRQIAKRYLRETGRERQNIRTKQKRMTDGHMFFTVIRVNRWLKEICAKYCGQCGQVSALLWSTPNRCNQCNRERRARYYATPAGREYAKRYQQSARGREVQRAASKRS